MASKKQESEGIALLSMYADDDDDVVEPQNDAVPPSNNPQLNIEVAPTNSPIFTETEAMDYTATVLREDPKEVFLDKFLPPPPKVKCSDELQEKIMKFLSLQKTTGRSFNAEVRNRKEYRNPDFLLHAVAYQDIDQIGTFFGKDVFDPHGYDKIDFYDEIEVDKKREMERKEQEKKSQKIEYISGGGSLSVPAAVDSVVPEGRANKKSKWDKVDGNRRNPLPTGGHDSVSVALLSSSNAAQQRWSVAEVKKSRDRKLERRS